MRLLASYFLILALASPALAQSPRFSRPFAGEYPLGNWHDHDSPREFVDDNGFILNSDGRTTPHFIDGHEGYDWLMPEGTPLFAVADGTVLAAGDGEPFVCPILGNQSTIAKLVTLEVQIEGEPLRVLYLHLSEALVTTGQNVRKGDLIGFSGNTGCSTIPHLHLAVFRQSLSRAVFTPIDPYGWKGDGEDPWAASDDGAASLDLWGAGEGPERFFDDTFAANDCEGCRAPVAITRVRWMGPNDDSVPNNELVELTLDTRFAGSSLNIGGYSLRNNSGKRVRLPKKLVLKAGRAISILSGKGRNSKKQRFLRQRRSLWNDDGDCVHLFDKQGNLVYSFFVGTASCRFSPFDGESRSGSASKSPHSASGRID